MKGHRGFTLTELIMTISISGAIILIISSMLFSGMSMINSNSTNINMGSGLQKGYTTLRDNVKQSNTICFKEAGKFNNDSIRVCNTPETNALLTDNKILLTVVENNLGDLEYIYYSFEDDQLIEHNKSKNTTRVIMEEINGEFLYPEKNVLLITLDYQNEISKNTLSSNEFYISLH